MNTAAKPTRKERLDVVFAKLDAAGPRADKYPDVSFILGADWGTTMGFQGGDPDKYRELAYAMALRLEAVRKL